MKIILPALGVLALAACTYSDINFERMSEAELATYNEGRAISQMIVCADNERAFSRVRRRECMTVEQMYGSVEQADQLGVLNQVQGIGAIDGSSF